MPYENHLWIADFQLTALGLLAIALAIGSAIRQPIKRLAIAWATTLAIMLSLVLVAIPGWSWWSLPRLSESSAKPAAEIDLAPLETPVAMESPVVPVLPAMDSVAESKQPVTFTTPIAPEPESFDFADAVETMTTVYLAGASLAAAWLLVGWWLARRLVGTAAEADFAASKTLESLTSKPPQLLVSDRLSVPVAIGFARPTILLPQGLAERADADELRTLLAHELAHIRGGDLWLLAGLRLLLIVLWCNPLYWVLRRRVRLDQETLADAAAVDQSDRHDYAERLIGWAKELPQQPRLAGSAGLWESPSQLRKRITVLLDESFVVLRRSSIRWRAVCVVGCSVLAILASLVTLGAAEPEDDPEVAVETDEGLTYSGVVVDKTTGEPIEGVDVLVRIKTSSEYPWPTLSETTYPTDGEGKYQFTITPKQVSDRRLYIEIEADHPDYARKPSTGYALSMIRKNEKLGEQPFFTKVELRPAEEVWGVLVDPEGNPAAGVNVLGYSNVVSDNFPREYGSFSSTETDDQGRFRLNLVAGGHSIVWLRPRDFAYETHVLKARKGDLGTFQLKQGIKLTGQVVDLEGQPISDVWVNAQLRGGPAKQTIEMPVVDVLRRSALTDAEGKFTMNPLPAGTYKVLPEERPSDSIIKDRTPKPLPATFKPQLFELSASNQDVDIQACESVLLRARTLTSDGKPTRGHGFHFAGRLNEDGSGFYFRDAKPDPEGNAEIRVPKGLMRGNLRFTTNEHGSLRVRLSPDEPLRGKQEIALGTVERDYDQIEIIRYTAPILIVEVVDAGDKPVENVMLSLIYKQAALNIDPDSHWIAEGVGKDSDVVFERQQDNRWRSSQLLPNEPFELRVSAQGKELSRQNLNLKEGETREIKLTQQTTTVFSPVSSNNDSPTTGRGKPNSISGRCLDASGKPIADAEVFLFRYLTRDQTTQQIGKQRTDQQGRFLWQNVVPEKPPIVLSATGGVLELYEVVARAPGLAIQSAYEMPLGIARDGREIDFVMNPAGKLTGRVTTSDSQPVAGAQVKAMVGSAFSSGMFRTATTDKEGRYAIDGLRVADYATERKRREEQRQAEMNANPQWDYLAATVHQEIHVAHPDYAIKKVLLQRVPDQLDIELKPAAAITGRAIDDDGKPVVGVRVAIGTAPKKVDRSSNSGLTDTTQWHQDFTKTDQSGRYRFSSLPADRFNVWLDLENGDTPLPERIATGAQLVDASTPGKTFEAPDLRVTKGRIIRLRLVDESTGQPLKFDQPMEASGHFMPEAGSAIGVLVRELSVNESGEIKLRITNEAGRLHLYRIQEKGVWAGEYEWHPEPEIDVPRNTTSQALQYKVEKKKAPVGVLIERAHQLKREGKTEAAIQYLTNLMKESPENVQLLLHRAGIARETGRHADAIADYERLIELKPSFLFLAQNYLANLLATSPDEKLRDPKRAVELAKQAVAGTPRPIADLFDTLGEAHAANGDYESAVQAMESAVEIALPSSKDKFRQRLDEFREERTD